MLARLRRLLHAPEPYDPPTYWEERSRGLIDAYDHPETWKERGWTIAGTPEATVVPELLARYGCASVLVAGAGSGRQYEYLAPLELADLRGFDLSQTMVDECTTRFPGITTVAANVVGCDATQTPADAVLSVTTLQHVRPEEIEAAVRSLRSLARRMLILLELTSYRGKHAYIFAHDYGTLLPGWELAHRQVVGELDGSRTELMAWIAPG